MRILRTSGKYELDVKVDDDVFEKFEFARLYGVPSSDQPDVFYVSVALPGGRAEFLSRLIMQPAPGMEVDHLDYDPLNNQRANLEVVTPAQNRQRRRYAPGRSGFIGVAVVDKGDAVYYKAHVKVRGKRVDLGRSATPEGAARIRDAGARLHYGPNARVNFPDEPVITLEEARQRYGRNLKRGRKPKAAPPAVPGKRTVEIRNVPAE